ncbi:hypothetical protein ACFL27_16890 [candidate division CSSED10-310 bacterium]|uniref:Glycosyltransferase 2-like domain-containing protein n=1 Tax=candidate division CSSED10-310 bacterium TaxID=2855610 RepID=A0ABV6Z096_UNCC1
MGDDYGTAEVAREYGLLHIPHISKNEYGTPLLNSIFEQAQEKSSYPLLCYVNTDIILLSDFAYALEMIRNSSQYFLVVGQRYDLDVNELLKFNSGWEAKVRKHVNEKGVLHTHFGIDYFIFPRGFWGKIPPFAIGRTIWDNWLIYRARSLRADVIDVSAIVTIIHQNHDFNHVKDGESGARTGPEAKRNLELAGGYDKVFSLLDVNYILTQQGLEKPGSIEYIRRSQITWPILHPLLSLPKLVLLKVYIILSKLKCSLMNLNK